MPSENQTADQTAHRSGPAPSAAEGLTAQSTAYALLWWLGTPVAVGVLTWGPYWIRNLALGRADWFRIPVLTGTVFDVMAYLQPIGQAMYGGASANLIGPFAPLMRAIAFALPGASVPEAWFVARWLSTTAALWIGAWCIRVWSGRTHGSAPTIGRDASRILSAAFWFSFVLVLGMKPGFASWLLPFGLIGLASVMLAHDRLRDARARHAVPLSAIFWSIVAVASSSLYAWYFLFVAVWLGIEWFLWFARKSLKVAALFFILGAGAAAALAVGLTLWTTQTPAGTVWLELMQRLSLSYTHMIFVSSSALLTALWAALFACLILCLTDANLRDRAAANATAWLALLFTFWSSPFTGHYIQNDHFRASAAVLSWFGLAAVWKITVAAQKAENGKREIIPPLSAWSLPRPACRQGRTEPKGFPRSHRFLLSAFRAAPLITLLISAAYVLRILAAPYAWNGDLLNVLQLTHWFALLAASWLVWRWVNGKRPLGAKTFYAVILGGALVIGGNAAAAMYAREFKTLPEIERLIPVFDWVKEDVPPATSLCADHGGNGFYSLDDVLAAHTGRIVHFAHTTLYHRERDAAFLDRLRVVSGFYDVRGAGDESYWQLQSSLNQFIVCEQYPLQTKLFRALGMPQSRIDALIGCPRQTIDARWAYVKAAIDRPDRDVEEFKRLCPYVVMPDDKKTFWRLPEGYLENRVMDGVSIFTLPS